MSITTVIQKIAYLIVHGTSLWFLLGVFSTSLAARRLYSVLSAHNARTREAKLAKQVSIGYSVLGIGLWLLSWLLS